MIFTLIGFHWIAMYSHFKREVLELINMNEKNVMLAFFFKLAINLSIIKFFNEKVTWQITWLVNTIYILYLIRTMSLLCVENFDSAPWSLPKF